MSYTLCEEKDFQTSLGEITTQVTATAIYFSSLNVSARCPKTSTCNKYEPKVIKRDFSTMLEPVFWKFALGNVGDSALGQVSYSRLR